MPATKPPAARWRGVLGAPVAWARERARTLGHRSSLGAGRQRSSRAERTMGAAISPDPQTIAAVVAQATRLRQARSQDDDRYRHFTEAAMAELVRGVEGEPVALGEDWWRVSKVVDAIAAPSWTCLPIGVSGGFGCARSPTRLHPKHRHRMPSCHTNRSAG